ncbi:MAG: apolipoprotein N-acyltransferase [Flavobacteriales bacterium]|nr:apolipoprotein N-acyltransferase [Flavobacteriales bacterium]
MRLRFFLFIGSGGLMLFLSWPPLTFFTFFIFIALVPLLILEKDIKDKKISYTGYFVSSYCTFFIFNLLTTFWVNNAHVAGAVFAILCNSLFMALVFYLYAKIKNSVQWKNPTFLLPILWIAFEYLHLNWDLSWPWLTLGNVFSAHPVLVQWYSYTGVLGGTLWILMINILVFKCYEKSPFFKNAKAYVLALFVAILAPFLFSKFLYNQYKYESDFMSSEDTQDSVFDTINVLVVQPNIDPYTDKFSLPQFDQIEDVSELIRGYIDSTFNYLILPETFLIDPIWEHQFDKNLSVKKLNQWIDKYQFDIIVGATTLGLSEKSATSKSLGKHKDSWYKLYNSVLYMRGQNYKIATYHKSKLVPGAEQMPFQRILYPFLGDRVLNIGESTSIGNFSKQDTISIFNQSIAPVICYESIYGDYVRKFVKNGAQVIFIITNDGWWKDTSGYRQHHMYAQLRAIETRRYIARSANTGISSVINPLGEIEQSLGWSEKGVIKATLELNTTSTFYVKHGDFLGRISAFLSILVFLYFFVINKLQFSRK